MPSSLQTNNRMVITVKEARKLLGQKSKDLTNEELQALIQDVETLVRISVRKFIGSKNNENNARMPSSKVTTL
ncbi:MAG TPA: hypothetical protein VK983_05005 [Candidatus Limnocylindrales bacterium]|nr:hypothetical protein [Candidatus Limnocylindrales bacterium]